jgi:hypothetical protein
MEQPTQEQVDTFYEMRKKSHKKIELKKKDPEED